MKKYLIVLFAAVLVISGSTVLADTYTKSASLKDNGYKQQVSQTSVKKLVDMENTLYGTVYDDQNLVARIERLENTVFNRYYPNYALDQRLNNLIYSYNRRYNQVNSSLARRIANGFNSAFIGVPTGFTPPISTDPYYNYYNGGYNGYNTRYGSNGWSTYSPSGWSSYGPNRWRNYNRYSGARSGVQIID